jgi:hypothetical protein
MQVEAKKYGEPEPPSEENLTQAEHDEIYPNTVDPIIKQGQGLNECYLACGLAEAQRCPIFQDVIKKTIRKIPGAWEVRFLGARPPHNTEPILVTEDEVKEDTVQIKHRGQPYTAEKISSPNIGDRILETAYGRYLKEVYPRLRDQPTFRVINRGGVAHHFLQVLLGPYVDADPQYSSLLPEVPKGEPRVTMRFADSKKRLIKGLPANALETLRYFALAARASREHIITVATPGKAKILRARKQNKEWDFPPFHEYGVRVIYACPAPKKKPEMKDWALLRIIDPLDTSQFIQLDFEEFLRVFRFVNIIHLLGTDQIEATGDTVIERVSGVLKHGQQ